MTRYSSKRKKPIVRGKATARIRPLGEAHLKRSGVINQGMSLYTILGSTNRTFTFSDVPAMLEDDQIALGVDYLKIPIAQAPIAVAVSHPEAYGYATDLIQRIWDALISKIDLSLAYGESCYEPLYKKDKKNMLWWDFHDFDIAPPMSSIPWTVNEKLAFVAVHGDGVTNSSYFSYWFDSESVQEADILEGAGVFRPTKALWICNDPLTSRWFGRTVLRPAHLRWKVKNMPDGGMESVAKALFKAAFSGLLLEYPANTSVVSEDGSVITSEQYADFLLQVVKSGSNVRLPSTVEGQPGWKILEYAKNLVDTAKLVPTLDYIDRGMLRGMGIPDDILNQGDKGGYSRSLVSIDAFYSRGEARARQYLPRIIDDIVNPLLRQRWGPQCEAKAHIMRQPRPDDNGQQQGGMDGDNNDVPDALEGAMRGNQGQQKALPGPNQQQQPPGKISGVQQAQQDGQTRFSLLMNRMRDRSTGGASVTFNADGDDTEDGRGKKIEMSVVHSPKGGKTIKGVKYAGGQFLPDQDDIDQRGQIGNHEDEKAALRRKFGEPYLMSNGPQARKRRKLTDEEYAEYKATVKHLVPNARVTRRAGEIMVQPAKGETWFSPWDAHLIMTYMRNKGLVHGSGFHAHPTDYSIERFRNIEQDENGVHHIYTENNEEYQELLFQSRLTMHNPDKYKEYLDGLYQGSSDEALANREKVRKLAKWRAEMMIMNNMNARVSHAQKSKYIDKMHEVIDAFPAPIVHRFVESTINIQVYNNTTELTAWHSAVSSSHFSIIGGCWQWHRQMGRGTLHLDGGYITGDPDAGRVDQHMNEIYAHELFHSADNDADPSGTSYKYSMSSAWEEAVKEEIMGGQLSDYAMTNYQEAWAEYGRLLAIQPSRARVGFPKCYNFLENMGLVYARTT